MFHFYVTDHCFHEQEPAKVCSYGDSDVHADLKNFCGIGTSPFANDNGNILAEIVDVYDACRFRAELKLAEFVDMVYLKFRFGNKTAQDNYADVFTVGSCGPISKHGTEVVSAHRYYNGTYPVSLFSLSLSLTLSLSLVLSLSLFLSLSLSLPLSF